MSVSVASKQIVNVLLDGIFPPLCIGCSKPGEWLCSACLETVPLIGQIPAPEDSPLSTLVAVSSYQHPIIGGLIRSFKYQRALCLEEEALGEVLIRFRDELDVRAAFIPKPTLIVPLPMDADRERTRGLDHALRLAKLIQVIFFPKVPVAQALTRTRASETNASLKNAAARAANMKDLFACQRSVSGEEVLLVDDVFTTGATMLEAAKVLHGKGVASTQGFVFAESKVIA